MLAGAKKKLIDSAIPTAAKTTTWMSLVVPYLRVLPLVLAVEADPGRWRNGGKLFTWYDEIRCWFLGMSSLWGGVVDVER